MRGFWTRFSTTGHRYLFLNIVYYNDIPVGTFCCRLETNGDQAKLYVMTMGVLAVSGRLVVASRNSFDRFGV